MKNPRLKAVKLRRLGKSYADIANTLRISKSTLSYWLRPIELTDIQKAKLNKNINAKLILARKKASLKNKIKREQYFNNIRNRNNYLLQELNNKNTAKLVLAALHLGEGSKNRRGSMQFGNSDPGIIKLLLKLMRCCYGIDDKKLRCTILCRADQNISELERFWRRVTKINLKQFYKTRIDPRTIGKPSRKLDYKGVCVINYFSAEVYYDLLTLGKMISE